MTAPTEAWQEIEAFRYHLTHHRPDSAPDCRFCTERDATKPAPPEERPAHDVRYFAEALYRAAQLVGEQEGLDTKLLAAMHLLNHYAEQARLRASGTADERLREAARQFTDDDVAELIVAAEHDETFAPRDDYVSTYRDIAAKITALRASLPSEREGQRE